MAETTEEKYKIIRRKSGSKIVFDLAKQSGEILAKACGSREEVEAIKTYTVPLAVRMV